MPLDLIDAVIANLESNPAVQSAFGDTWNETTQAGIPKFYADVADSVPLPSCVLTEIGETYQYMTHSVGLINFTAPGQMAFSVYAADRYQARALGVLIGWSLNDAPVAWQPPASPEVIMLFRMANSRLNPIGAVAPQQPIVFNRVFMFEYEYQGRIS